MTELTSVISEMWNTLDEKKKEVLYIFIFYRNTLKNMKKLLSNTKKNMRIG